MSLAICGILSNKFTLEPSISCQFTATSPIGMPNVFAKYNNSTSNAQRSICCDGKIFRAACLENNIT